LKRLVTGTTVVVAAGCRGAGVAYRSLAGDAGATETFATAASSAAAPMTRTARIAAHGTSVRPGTRVVTGDLR
jgi:hypothetical protein